MNVLVVYESMWGNTEQVARAIAAGMSETNQVQVLGSANALGDPGPDVSLIVGGGPTHAFSMSRPTTRTDAHNRGATHGSETVGIRDWLTNLPVGRDAQAVATFDSKVSTMKHLPGSAAKSAAKVAAPHGYQRAAHAESFFVSDTDGPLLDGELERATQWGRHLAAATAALG